MKVAPGICLQEMDAGIPAILVLLEKISGIGNNFLVPKGKQTAALIKGQT